jgi:DnaK suppressor protein
VGKVGSGRSAAKPALRAAAKSVVAKPAASVKKVAAKPVKARVEKVAAARTAPVRAAAKRPAAKVAASTTPVRPVQDTAARAAREVSPPAAAPVRTMDPGLNEKDLEMFRTLLLEKRNEILGNMNAMREETGGGGSDRSELSSMPIHMADLGTDHFERELTLTLLDGERSLLRDIDSALDRIREGTYGLCLATGKPIGKARLKAQPWAKYCMEYMQQQESRRRFRY